MPLAVMDSSETTLHSGSEAYLPLEKYQLPHLHPDLSVGKCCEQRGRKQKFESAGGF